MAELFRALHGDAAGVAATIAAVKSKLLLISTMFNELTAKSDTELIADSIEAELAGMDKAIEEAAAQIEVRIFEKKSFLFLIAYGFAEYVVQITCIGQRYKAGGERKNPGCLYGSDEKYSIFGAKITVTSGRNCSSRQR